MYPVVAPAETLPAATMHAPAHVTASPAWGRPPGFQLTRSGFLVGDARIASTAVSVLTPARRARSEQPMNAAPTMPDAVAGVKCDFAKRAAALPHRRALAADPGTRPSGQASSVDRQ